MNRDAAAFFEGHLQALALYAAFEAAVREARDDVRVRVQKTQITLSNRHVFACVSRMRVKPRATLPPEFIVVSQGLPYPLSSPRVAAQIEPYPGRWTNHVVLASPQEIDAELLCWTLEAYDFAQAK